MTKFNHEGFLGDQTISWDQPGRAEAVPKVARLEPRVNGERKANERWQLATVRLSDVEPERTNWLWPGRLAAGKLTLFAGDPGLGKSQITIDIAARVTTGADWPDDGTAPLGNVVILSAEDGVADTLRPRFEAAGGDLERVRVVTTLTGMAGNRRSFTLQSDLALLSENVRAFGNVKLVVIDPITSYCGKVDGNSTTDIRAVLAPLSEFAEEHRLSLIAVSHPPKSAAGGKALYAVTGSLAWIAAARTAFTIVEDAEDTGRRLFLNSKNNIAPLAPGIGYRLVQRIVTGDCVASHIAWDNLPVTMSADQALAATAGGDSEARSMMDEATEFLRDALAGGPISAKDGEEHANALGIARRTLMRARKSLGVIAEKSGTGGWTWRLEQECQPDQGCPPLILGTLGTVQPDQGLSWVENSKSAKSAKNERRAPEGHMPALGPPKATSAGPMEMPDIPQCLRRAPPPKGERLGPPAISSGPDDDLADLDGGR